MSRHLFTLHDSGHDTPFTEDMLDEWFRSLNPADKVRLFWLEVEPEEQYPYQQAQQLRTGGVAAFVEHLDGLERSFALALSAPLGTGVPGKPAVAAGCLRAAVVDPAAVRAAGGICVQAAAVPGMDLAAAQRTAGPDRVKAARVQPASHAAMLPAAPVDELEGLL